MKIFSMIIGLLMLLDIPARMDSVNQTLLTVVYVLVAGTLIVFPLYLEFMR